MGDNPAVNEWERYTATYPDRESVSGPGSTLDFTTGLREWLPTLFTQYDIRSVLDAPCGDFHWLSHVDLTGIDYLGWDVQPALIERNKTAHPGKTFDCVNLLTKRIIPTVDLILCRDLFAHLPDKHVSSVLAKFTKSGSRYLLATNFDVENTSDNPYDSDGFYYRPVNLCAPPFNMPTPLHTLDEPGPEPGRHMALWEL